MKPLTAGLLVVVCFALGCRSTTPKPRATPLVALTQVLIPVEKSGDFYDRAPRPIRPDSHLTRIDYQSELVFGVETNKLSQLLSQSPSVLPALTPAEQDKLTKLSLLIDAARVYLRDYDKFIKEFDKASNQPMSSDQIEDLKKLINAQGTSGLALNRQLTNYVDTKLRNENPGADRRQLFRLRRPFEDSIYPGGQVLSLPGLTDFVAAERSALLARRLSDADTVRKAGSFHLRVRASTSPSSGGPPTPIHVENYDTRENLNIASEPRLSFRMSEEDRQRLSEQNKVNSDIAKLAKDLQDGKSNIRESLNGVVSAFRGDLRGWQIAVTNLDLIQAKAGELAAALTKAENVAGLGDNLKNIARTAQEAFLKTSNDVRRIRETLTVKSDPDVDPADVLMSTATRLFGGFENAIGTIRETRLAVSNQLAVLRKNLESFRSADTGNVLQQLFEAVTAAAPGAAPATADAVTGLLQEAEEEYPALAAAVRNFLVKGPRLAAAEKLQPIQDDVTLREVDLFNPPNGSISLLGNLARGGVTLTLDAAVVARQPDGSVSGVTSVHQQKFAVEKFGLINTWSADLIFVKRLGNLDADEREVQFSPAPSISWTMHYNPPPPNDPATDRGPNKWWKAINPGLGLNVAALNFEENGVQVGIGGHLTLMNDLVISGVGYNLNESRHGTYFFVGLSIFEGLSKMGIDLPVGR